MYQRRQKFPFRLLLIILMLSVISIAAAQDDGGEVEPERQALNVVISVSGEVEVERALWSMGAMQPLEPGMTVIASDIIVLDPGEEVVVLCGDRHVDRVDTYGSPQCNPLPDNPTFGVAGDTVSRNRRAGPDLTIPYLLLPRNTAITNTRPKLSWASVADASTYDIRVLRTGQEVLAVTGLTETEYTLSETQPDLVPGRYVVEVTANLEGTGTITNTGDSGSTFTVLSAEDAIAIDTGVEEIRNLVSTYNVSDEILLFVEALYYEDRALLLDALIVLSNPNGGDLFASPDTVRNAGVGTATYYLLLGDLYNESALTEQAQVAFEVGLGLAVAQNNAEIEALTRVRLARLLTDTTDKYCNLIAAIGFFEVVGDEETVQSLTREANAAIRSDSAPDCPASG